MADVTSVVSAVEAKVTSAVADVKADVSKDVAVVKSTWTTKVLPWITHAASVVGGYLAAHFIKL